MIILNDVELIMAMRSLHLIKGGVLGITQLYLTECFMEPTEKIVIKELEEKGDLVIFDLSNDFYKFYNNTYKENPTITMTDISSVYCAKKFSLPLISRCEHVRKFALENNVVVCELSEALKNINANSEQINFLEYIMNNIMTN